jgi:hypothetical protein
MSDGLGYGGGVGPGTPGTSGAGAGHGGIGGGSGGGAYDDVYQPVELGSGGGGGCGLAGGAGGGAIQLDVTNGLVLNGLFTANGLVGIGADYCGGTGGGSGGSIWIKAGEMSGSGVIQANGGNGGAGGYGYGGAGGRVAIDVPESSNTFNGTVTAYGGSRQGGAGTMYWTGGNRLVVDNNSQVGNDAILPEGNYSFDKVEMHGDGYLRVQGAGSEVTLGNGALSGDGTGRLEVEGVINAPADFTVEGVNLVVLNELSGVDNITLRTSGGMELHAGAAGYPGGEYTFGNVTVGSGTTLRVVPFIGGGSYTADYGLKLDVSSLTVENGGTLSGDGLGYGGGVGPGTPGTSGAGAGHGGIGGGSGGGAYDDVYQPVELGSGGGGGCGLAGGAGGGAIQLDVTNGLVLNGLFTANGLVGIGADYCGGTGGGSGGSIWIKAGEMSGSGVIQANGGNGGAGGYGYGGAGGRVAIDVPESSNTFNGTVTAYGGSRQGGAGTMYWTGGNRLVVDNNSQVGNDAILPEGNYSFDKVEMHGDGYLRVQGAGSEVTLGNGALSGDGTGRLEVEGVINAPADFTVEGVNLVVLNELSGVDNITLRTSGGMELHAGAAGYPGGEYTFGNVTVGSGTTLRVVPFIGGGSYTADYGLKLDVSSLTVENGGTIMSGDGLGYGSGVGPGTPGTSGAGAGHGGIGGGSGGGTYDDVYQPVEPGSGGGNGGGCGLAGGAGGGAIQLDVTSGLVLNGLFTANGLVGIGADYCGGSGGGSGGSIWIKAGEMSGSGVIQANGGNGGWEGGGAGGRVAIYSSNIAPTIKMNRRRRQVDTQAGGTGSIYIDGIDANLSTVQIVPASVAVTDANGATLTVTLLNSSGYAVPNKPSPGDLW